MSRRGTAAILASALLFALGTLFGKIATTTLGAHPLWVTMSRFVIGFLLILPTALRNPGIMRANAPQWVALRSATNLAAVFLVFFALSRTTVSKVNLLNMTYPVFVFLSAPIITGERTPRALWGVLAVTGVGVWLVVEPTAVRELASVAVGDLLALASGVIAGGAISVLRRARRHDSTPTILFWMMTSGVFINGALLPFVAVPDARALAAAAAAGLAGAIGQVLLTVGFSDVRADTGALLSTARIPIAALLGVAVLGDRFGLREATGSLLIIVSLIATSQLRAPDRRPGSPGSPGMGSEFP